MSEVVKVGKAVLREVAKPVTEEEFLQHKKMKHLIADMKKTMYAENGVGLAAPQIGLSKRIFVADCNDGFDVYINPEWEPLDDSKVIETEGCLSVSVLYGEVERYAHVIVKYQDIRGKRKQKKATGLFARCVQHEIDHLNGTLFIDKAITLNKR